MIFSILKKIKFKGRLEITDYSGKTYQYGEGNIFSKIRFINKSIERKLVHNPSLYLGEGYMDGDIIIEQGSLDDFLNIITSSYDDFLSRSLFFKMYEKISNFFKYFHQINRIIQSKKNVSYHYDLNENLYKLFLDKDMQYSCAYFHNQNIGLDQAQYDKKKHIIEKLQIKENMSVLDIGCGWGGMALQIAKDTGATCKRYYVIRKSIFYSSKKSTSRRLK